MRPRSNTAACRVVAAGAVLAPEAPATIAAAAAVYPGRSAHAQLWYYDFRGFARPPTWMAATPSRPSWVPGDREGQLMRQSGGGELVRYGAEHFGARRLPTLSFGVRVLVRTPLRARAQRSRMSIPPAEREQQGRKRSLRARSSALRYRSR